MQDHLQKRVKQSRMKSILWINHFDLGDKWNVFKITIRSLFIFSV